MRAPAEGILDILERGSGEPDFTVRATFDPADPAQLAGGARTLLAALGAAP